MRVMVPSRLGGGIAGSGRRAVGDAVIVAGREARQGQQHEGEGNEEGREDLEQGHDRDTHRVADHPREIALFAPYIRHP